MNTPIEQKEGPVAKAIETRTSKIPSDVFLFTGLAIGAAAVTLFCMKKKSLALLIGQGVAPVLLLGVYNKLVKQLGHDIDDPIVDSEEKNSTDSKPKKMAAAGSSSDHKEGDK